MTLNHNNKLIVDAYIIVFDEAKRSRFFSILFGF